MNAATATKIYNALLESANAIRGYMTEAAEEAAATHEPSMSATHEDRLNKLVEDTDNLRFEFAELLD